MTTTIVAHLRSAALYCNNLSKTTVGKERLEGSGGTLQRRDKIVTLIFIISLIELRKLCLWIVGIGFR